jgi:hypothetical protein
MEVHAHTHTARKKWTHYFWEFLMLFLAVFCGFLAEYQLEHKIEKDRGKQYIRSLIEDLGEDTLILSDNIEDCEGHMKRIDTLVRLLNSDEVRNHGSDLYYFGRRSSRGVRLALHDLTIQQMKNSGGFRLISKEKVSRAIIEYYNRLVFIDYLQNIGMSEAEEYRKMAIDVFHPVLFNEIVMPDNTIARPANNPPLLTYEPKVLLRLSGMLSYIRNTKLGLFKAEIEMRTAAIDLIQLIKKEYHLK